MTLIEWTDKTWNPITGCTKVSAGCKNCYAEGVAKRFWGDRPFSYLQFHPERLLQPLKWRKPCMVFVNSMSDLFHKSVTDEQLDQIFAVMALTPQHTYQILTKRPERMMEYCRYLYSSFDKSFDRIAQHAVDLADSPCAAGYVEDRDIPFSNIWLGVTVENQKAADDRIPLLLQTPAAVRFLSCEPLLEEIDISDFVNGIDYAPDSLGHQETSPKGDWVVVGGDVGPKARPCDIAWIRSTVQQCGDARVPCWVTSVGGKPVMNVYDWYEWCDEEGFERDEAQLIDWNYRDGQPPINTLCKVPLKGKGDNPGEWPEDIRVRQKPSVEGRVQQ